MFALIGYPLGHSMSPFIHKRLFELSGKNDDYELFEIAPENLEKGFSNAIERYDGLNVTIPHKTEIIPFLDGMHESAARYNAVNCIAREKGRLIGYNTDCIGFLRSVPKDALGKKFLISGCGGAGRMMALEAAAHGADITIAIKDFSAQQAEILINEINEKFPQVTVRTADLDNIEGRFDLFANATPVGMYPHIEGCPVSEKVIENCENIFDAVYNPADTLLLRTAKQYGCRCVGGMAMLAWQGAQAHRIWDGDCYTPAQIDQVIDALYSGLNNNVLKREEEEQHP